MTLTPTEVKRFYDRFGAKQDSQGFYEDPACDDLIVNGAFDLAERVFEFGCGTGRLGARLLSRHLPPTATYLCCDVSETMTELTRQRLARFGKRVEIIRSDGAVRFPLPDRSVDRVVAAYVLDLLSDEDIVQAFHEAHRVLVAGGKFCIACLTKGTTFPSRAVSTLWAGLFRLHPAWVGGCRPISLIPFVDRYRWQVEHRAVLTPFGVPSEVLILNATVLLVDRSSLCQENR